MAQLTTPYFLVDEGKLKQNLELLRQVQQEAGCKILLAQKAFSMFACYPLISRYLCGTTASGLFEPGWGWRSSPGGPRVLPRLPGGGVPGAALLGGPLCVQLSRQLKKFGERAKAAGKQVGLRINPECSTQEGHAIYDPCAPGSRLGATLANFDESLLPLLDGLHFHTLCEQDSDDLEVTAKAFEEKFGPYLPQMKWLNLGGGHHITRRDYDIPRLVRVVKHFREKYGLEVYLEPGEAVVLNAGFLVSTVLEIVHNGMDIAILDTSAACHMPDVLEMPYRPPVKDSGKPGEKPYTYRLAGPTCLAGDVIGDYSFDEPLKEGSQIVLEDMALYTMVKTNTFNGMPLPAIALGHEDGAVDLVKEFGYEDFKSRLS